MVTGINSPTDFPLWHSSVIYTTFSLGLISMIFPFNMTVFICFPFLFTTLRGLFPMVLAYTVVFLIGCCGLACS